MKTNMELIKSRSIWSLSPGAGAMAWIIVAAVLFCGLSCKKEEQEGDPVERAKQEIIDLLVLPPDSALKSSRVEVDKDTFILSYGTNNSMEELAAYFKKGVREKKYGSVMHSESGVSYKTTDKKQVTVLWYGRDPDISEFKTVFHVAVVPLPPELKEAPSSE